MSDELRSTGGFLVPELHREETSRPIRDALPVFTATRGGVDFNRRLGPPPTRWQKRKWRWAVKVRHARRRIALRVDPSLETDPWDDW